MPTLTRSPLELVVRSGGRQLARCLLKRGRYHLGQERANDIVIDEPSISRRHARLEVVNEGEIYLQDLGSANGSYVDSQLAESAVRVAFTSFVQLGNASLEFQRGGLPAAVAEYLPGDFLHPSRYDAGGLIARGGVSTIHQAHDLSLGRTVAIRTMQPACQRSAATVIRFVREAQIMAQLQHPNIPPVYEMRLNEEGLLFYTTRSLEGESLANILDRLREGTPDAAERWPLPMLLTAWQKACDAIAFAHARGVVHCALRPENIIVGDCGEVLVIGWTFAHLQPADHEIARPDGRVTAPGEAAMAALTPYTAPELVVGTGIFDERADIYSLAALLYSILAWKAPFPEGDDRVLTRQILTGEVIPPQIRAPMPENGIGERLRDGLAETAMQGMHTSPARRPASVSALQAEASVWQGGLAWAEVQQGRRGKFGGLLSKR